MLTNDSSRFFHTLVVLGAALGAGCGGSLDTPPSDDSSASGGSATGGAPAGTGGASGGAPAAAGGSVTATGGVLIEPPPDTEWPFSTDCPTAQQACLATHCPGLPSGPCTCDGLRPGAANECAEGHDFVCRAERVWVGDLDVEVRFGCACVPREAACDCPHGGYADGCDEWTSSPREILCGGCPIILK